MHFWLLNISQGLLLITASVAFIKFVKLGIHWNEVRLKKLAVRLPSDVYDSKSIEAIAISAHETSRVLRYVDGFSYLPLSVLSIFQFAVLTFWGAISNGPLLIACASVPGGLYIISKVLEEFSISRRAILELAVAKLLNSQEIVVAKEYLKMALFGHLFKYSLICILWSGAETYLISALKM
ncbi:hypothetical protein WKK05_40635 (plasmid) [Nostoc sp. UHCC 0302]|uniref:hypothetical protein n=1 Tax=Nostoc sp. UHCC 0302 TaxID=3134896 RepID=UPI00311CD79D